VSGAGRTGWLGRFFSRAARSLGAGETDVYLTGVVKAYTLTYMDGAGWALERRYTPRVRVEMFLNQYVRDRAFRALATNLSPTGLRICKLVEPNLPLARIVSLEFEIPGTGEIVWASAEPRFDALDEDFQTSGLTFVNMARKHERLLREFILRKESRTSRRRQPRERNLLDILPGRTA
jgi:hypothetical protein